MLFKSKTLSKKSKLKLYNSVIRSTVTYASETWVLKKQIEEKLIVFEGKIIRRIYGPERFQPKGSVCVVQQI
jgi:hypothetical protein